MTAAVAPLMLPGMSRRLLLSLLGLALPICSAQAAGLPCLPCAGLRLTAPPVLQAPAAAGADDRAEPRGASQAPASQPPMAPGAPGGGSSGLLNLLRADRLPPGSPLFIAWEVALPPPAAPSAVPAPAAAPSGG